MDQDIKIIRGTTNEFDILITDDKGEPYALTEGETLRFGVKRNGSCSSYDIKKELISSDRDAETGAYRVKIQPDDTINLSCGIYYYDVGIQSGTEYYNIIEYSRFIILYNVTAKGD